MREWIFAGSIIAMMFGLGFGIAIRPELAVLDDAVADLTFCEIDRDDAITKAKAAESRCSRAATERDRAVKHSEDWQGWYEDANRDRAALMAELGRLRSEIAAFRFAYEAKSAELAAAKPVPLVQPVKATVKKKKRKSVGKRKPVRVVYRWHLF